MSVPAQRAQTASAVRGCRPRTPSLPQFRIPIGSLGHWLVLFAFLLGCVGATYLLWREGQSQVLVAITKRALPTYHQIQPNDLDSQILPSRNVPTNAIIDSSKLIGRYTLIEIPQSQPLTTSQLGPMVDTSLMAGTVAVGVYASSAMALANNLKAGDIVNITWTRLLTSGVAASVASFDNILVLDVQKSPDTTSSAVGTTQSTILVIALPVQRRMEFAEKSAGATLLITLK